MAALVGSNSGSAGGQVDIDVALTISTNDNRYVFAFFTIGDDTPATGTSEVSSSQDGTLSSAYAIQAFNAFHAHIGWELVAPSSGATTFTGERDANYNIQLAVVEFQAVDQTTPTGTWLFDTGANLSIDVTSTGADDAVVGGAVADDNAFGETGDGTEEESQANYGSDGITASLVVAAGAAGTVTPSWDNASGSYGAGAAAANINNAAGGGGNTSLRRRRS